ncbi:FAD-binding oxidoreductase [Mycobacterium sp. GA-2829]|uniref:NAD(P)/FAD-dependent oxidoreductase n=1 Tax=Mycobacterium sp. GA-2829 TaxID=1772283 RepID=UPI0007404E53|nr:FAD-dependent oxidoreductase [Mycobacterium sp. GA-2829]KUI38265.1 amino acid dehydrogenase [Mycobacterium sp. GA-2829]
MVVVGRIDGGPRTVIVVGAGIVGLSTAWFLQERGVDVTLVERGGTAASESHGNAGWVSPALALPLNSPALIRAGWRSLSDGAPVHLPMTANSGLAAFAVQFAAHCRRSSRERATLAAAAFNEDAIEAFDVLTANGVDADVRETTITALFRTPRGARRMLRELADAGQVDTLSGGAVRERVPAASSASTAALAIGGQRLVEPGAFVRALERSVLERGATLRTVDARAVFSSGNGVTVYAGAGEPLTADAAVIATGAWLPRLTRGRIRVPIQSARGYAFTVPTDIPVSEPVYLPDLHVMCTPRPGGLHVSGSVEFRDTYEPAMTERVGAIVAAVDSVLDGVRWAERTDIRVVSSPVSPDGRPLIGEISRAVYAAGGHGLWGLTHGPVTGRLLAEYVTTGKQPDPLREFDPLRRTGR